MFRCMRTTIRLDDGLLATAKGYAASAGLTLTALIEEALRQRLAQARDGERKPVRLLTTGAGGVVPGIDMDDSSALLEAMEAGDDPY